MLRVAARAILRLVAVVPHPGIGDGARRAVAEVRAPVALVAVPVTENGGTLPLVADARRLVVVTLGLGGDVRRLVVADLVAVALTGLPVAAVDSAPAALAGAVLAKAVVPLSVVVAPRLGVAVPVADALPLVAAAFHLAEDVLLSVADLPLVEVPVMGLGEGRAAVEVRVVDTGEAALAVEKAVITVLGALIAAQATLEDEVVARVEAVLDAARPGAAADRPTVEVALLPVAALGDRPVAVGAQVEARVVAPAAVILSIVAQCPVGGVARAPDADEVAKDSQQQSGTETNRQTWDFYFLKGAFKCFHSEL